jgi:hypothetical protein
MLWVVCECFDCARLCAGAWKCVVQVGLSARTPNPGLTVLPQMRGEHKELSS